MEDFFTEGQAIQAIFSSKGKEVGRIRCRQTLTGAASVSAIADASTPMRPRQKRAAAATPRSSALSSLANEAREQHSPQKRTGRAKQRNAAAAVTNKQPNPQLTCTNTSASPCPKCNTKHHIPNAAPWQPMTLTNCTCGSTRMNQCQICGGTQCGDCGRNTCQCDFSQMCTHVNHDTCDTCKGIYCTDCGFLIGCTCGYTTENRGVCTARSICSVAVDKRYREIIQPSVDAFLVDTIDAAALELRKQAAREQSAAEHKQENNDETSACARARDTWQPPPANAYGNDARREVDPALLRWPEWFHPPMFPAGTNELRYLHHMLCRASPSLSFARRDI